MEFKFNFDTDRMIDKVTINKIIEQRLNQAISDGINAYFYERYVYIHGERIKDKGIGRIMVEELISKELEKPDMQAFIKSKIDKMMDEQIENICAAKLNHLGRKIAFTTDHQFPGKKNV